ncbi:MHYT domain-containing protein [Nocardiopsis composta]|uniref:NO-binding membrane sensor protein with MHYT domain n=1 Tax=Nocardiopsis composta TaxID=157465 RepID=A0A7W8QNU8_9ACTN|nr:MHYT domain-containing protein [Nocardiopsis composta]MBB5433409.1 NO-binding membrane sensor protein with MHYT domain [Nocardiopsis composta]
MVEHYAYGLWTPVLAYAVSVLGSFLGLRCATRARGRGGPGQAGWIAMGAVSIGGVGVWAMHFIAMLGFRIHGAPIRYDLTLTVVSAVIPMAVMALALYLIIVGGRRWALPVSGAVVAVGVVSMHYLGMASMNGHAGMGHDPVFVAAACAIALVASVVALWFVGHLWTVGSTLAGALVMGVAVSAMHYTAMMGVVVGEHAGHGETPAGIPALDFLTPLIVGPGVFLITGFLLLMMLPDERREREREQKRRQREERRRPAAPEPARGGDVWS